jgi:hypothetical protein
MVTFEPVVQLKFIWVTVVVRAVDPMTLHKLVPVALLSLTFASGLTVTPVTFAVLRIYKLKLKVELVGITPAVLGTLGCVSNSLMR